MTTKECTKCGEVKPLSEYSKNSRNKTTGLQPKCKACDSAYYKKNREQIRDRISNHYENNKKAILAQMKLYREKNKEAISEREKKYYQENKKSIRKKNKAWYENNREQVNNWNKQYQKERLKTDISFKLARNLRKRTWDALKHNAKSVSTLKMLGCTTKELRKHLESQFTEGMSWDNYGYNGWHIDHIIPCASFDLSDPEQQRQCFHYTNLQPLWAEDNLRKSDKIL